MKRNLGVFLLFAASIGATSAARAMDLEDVFALLHSGVGEAVILEQMEAEGAVFVLETEEILALKDAGASDRLLRAMIESGDVRREERRAYEERQTYGREDADWTDGYYDVDRALRVDLVYDPFGYHWYASPTYFVYYYPFRTWDFGFYFAGWHHWRWWGWDGYWPTYYRRYCDWHYYHAHHHHYYDHNDGRYRDRVDRAWTRSPRDGRDRHDAPGRIERERKQSPYRELDRSRDRRRSDPPARDGRAWDRTRRSEPSGRIEAPRSPSRDRSTPSRPSTPRNPGRDRSPTRTGGWGR